MSGLDVSDLFGPDSSVSPIGLEGTSGAIIEAMAKSSLKLFAVWASPVSPDLAEKVGSVAGDTTVNGTTFGGSETTDNSLTCVVEDPTYVGHFADVEVTPPRESDGAELDA